jgi:hypothetical protein
MALGFLIYRLCFETTNIARTHAITIYIKAIR